MSDTQKAETPKAKKPRKPRTYHLIEVETMQVVSSEPTLKLLREFKPTEAQSSEKRQFIEAAQIGKPFIIRKVESTVREQVK